MRRFLPCAAALLVIAAVAWHPGRAGVRGPGGSHWPGARPSPRASSTSVAPIPASAPEAAPDPSSSSASTAPEPSLEARGVAAKATSVGVRWTVQDGTVAWGWAEIEGLASEAPSVREEGGRWVVEHGAIEEVFEPRRDGIEHVLTVKERPEALRARIAVDADARAWKWGEEPRVTLSRPQEGDLVEVRGLEVRDATGKELHAELLAEAHAVVISVDDAGATYPVTIDPLITTPAWTADPSDKAGAGFASSVASAGDFNRDGYADILCGGRIEEGVLVRLYFGSAQGPAAAPAWTTNALLDWQENGGVVVAGAGDVNGDGFSDVAVSETGWRGSDERTGRVLLYLGGTNGPTSAIAWTGSEASTRSYGCSVAAAGDVNRDGREDLLVGAYGGSGRVGAAYLYSGTTSGLTSAPTWTVAPLSDSYANFGWSVASAGDVNGDGYVDVIVGAPGFTGEQQTEGRAYLYLGTPTGLSTTPAWTADPTDRSGGQFGACVAGAGDMNNDGYADVLIGAPGYARRVYLYPGSPSGLSSTPTWVVEAPSAAGYTSFGRNVLSPGDLNGDGYRDVVVSDSEMRTTYSDGGAAIVYLGSSSGLSTTPSMVLSPAGLSNLAFGSSVAAAGDTNGDGRPDLLVGAPGWSSTFYNGEGRAYVYYGTGSNTATPWLLSPADGSSFGSSTTTLDWADCVDRDGIQSYEVQIDTGSDTSGPDFVAPFAWTGTASTSQVTTPALADGRYFWRVRSRDTLGNLSEWSLYRSFFLDGTPPTASQPSSPVNDALTTPTPLLRWTKSTDSYGAPSYDLEVSSTSDFSSPAEWTGTGSYLLNTRVMTALAAGRHWWRVRARDTWGWTSAWSAGASFVVDEVAPSAPTLLSPANGSAVQAANVPFDWDDATDANGVGGYDIVVSDDPNFAVGRTRWSGSVTASEAESGWVASAATTLYWRVRTRDVAGNLSSWSATWSFTTSNGLPPTVNVVGPNGGGVTSSPVALDWTDATDPDGIAGYDVQVATDLAFAGTVVWSGSSTASDTTTGSLPQGQLYWRVRAVDSLGNRGLWRVAIFYLDSAAPTTPSPVSPADGAVIAQDRPYLEWTDSTDNLELWGYLYEIASEPTFTPPIVESNGAIGSGVSPQLPADGTYYWRVRARDFAGNLSAWSAVRSFVIDAALPAAPTLLSPASGATVATGTPTLDWSDVPDPSGVTYEVQVDDMPETYIPPFIPPYIASATGLTASQWTTPFLGDTTVMYWRVRAIDGLGHVGAWSATSTFTIDRGRGFYVGLGAGAGGRIACCKDEAAGWLWRPVYTLANQNSVYDYNAASGETRPASGDLDGDGLPELVVGRARYTLSGGWFSILDDQATGYALVRWIQIPFNSYNYANGETWPACGDIDGDGKDEIAIGLGRYTSLGGYFALYNDASTNYAFIGWKRVPWSAYNSSNGETRPAIGDVTGDRKAEVFVGLGRYPSRGGRIARFTSGSVSFSSWGQFAYSSYNSANGETWPAFGDVDADGRDELCIGMGAYTAGGGYVQYQDDATRSYASLGFRRLPWTEYNNAVGETRPSLGPLAGGAGDETVIGLGAWSVSRGYLAVLDSAPGYALRTWRRFPIDVRNETDGATRPSVRR